MRKDIKDLNSDRFNQPLDTRLFEARRAYQLFQTLGSLGRGINKLYNGKCEREIFVRRALDPKFKHKCFVLLHHYDSGAIRKEYIQILRIEYYLGYSNEILIYYLTPFDICKVHEMIVGYNELIAFEGYEISSQEFIEMQCLFLELDMPKKKYSYYAYDFNKCPKRRLKNQSEKEFDEYVRDKTRYTVTFEARTYTQAFRKTKEFTEKEKGNLKYIDNQLRSVEVIR